ncbi:MAG: NUDIX domain-containing protein [Candidatus Woesearchaeota archaeon]|nr:NUDIX domain-containing protein [Candidatus Woesearchaeota archaeon]
MQKETSSGIIVFKRSGMVKYLILNYPVNIRSAKEYWGLVKGHVEKDESLEEAAVRETREETGLIVDVLPGFKEKIVYNFAFKGALVEKTVYFFAGESVSEEVKLSHEHKGYAWLSFDDALKQLSYDKDKDVLIKANSFLKEISIS